MNKKIIGILFGGVSTEYEISLQSASFIIDSIDKEKYDIKTIGISKNGDWFIYRGNTEKIKNNSWLNEANTQLITLSLMQNQKGFFTTDKYKNNFQYEPIDVLFPVLHGRNGEDGSVQALCKLANIPFVGCDHSSSSICIDKELTHIMLEKAGIKTSPYTSLKEYEFSHSNFDDLEKKYKTQLGYPMFVKPANAGSSVGVSKANNKNELIESIKKAFQIDKKIVIEKCIVGQEIECAVIGNDEPFASILGEIAPSNEFYDYDAKYNDENSLLYIPANISSETSNKIRQTAIKAFKALSCSGMARIDFFLTKDKEIILNEPNTIPGFTNISMYPKLLMKSGFDSKKIINDLISLALEYYNNNLKYDEIVNNN